MFSWKVCGYPCKSQNPSVPSSKRDVRNTRVDTRNVAGHVQRVASPEFVDEGRA